MTEFETVYILFQIAEENAGNVSIKCENRCIELSQESLLQKIANYKNISESPTKNRYGLLLLTGCLDLVKKFQTRMKAKIIHDYIQSILPNLIIHSKGYDMQTILELLTTV